MLVFCPLGTKENHIPGMISRVDECYRDGSGVARTLIPDGYTPDKVWLMCFDLEKLNRYIKKGEQLAICERLPEEVSGSRWAYTPHQIAEHRATKREAVLAAAIYAKKAWLNECGTTYVAWATAISNYNVILFDEDRPPFNRETILIVRAEPYKCYLIHIEVNVYEFVVAAVAFKFKSK